MRQISASAGRDWGPLGRFLSVSLLAAMFGAGAGPSVWAGGTLTVATRVSVTP